MSEDELKNTICFDYSHNNTLTIESPSYADFTQFLFGSSFIMGKIQAGFTDIEKLSKYRMLVIGGPRESDFSKQEIEVIEEFVRTGGNLLIIHDEGGDYNSNTNLNELTQHFGFKYNNDIVFDSLNFQSQQSRIIVKDFEPHSATISLDAIVLSSACSIEINQFVEADENIKIMPLAKSSLNSFKTCWNGKEWEEELDAPRSIMAVCTNYYKGNVIGLCTVSMFSSLSSSYGFTAMSNQIFISSIYNWLLESDIGDAKLRDEKLINIPVNYNLFIWMEKLIQKNSWNNIGDIVNFAVKYLKDDYENILIMGEEKRKLLKEKRDKQLIALQKISNVDERRRQTKLLQEETNILELGGFNIDTAKELEGIMQGLSNITGGKVGADFNLDSFAKDNYGKNLAEIEEEKSRKIKPEDTLLNLKQKKIDEKNESVEKEFVKNKKSKQISKTKSKKKSKKSRSGGKSLKSRADEALDAAMKSLNSFDEFSKKLEKFKALSDDDEPVK